MMQGISIDAFSFADIAGNCLACGSDALQSWDDTVEHELAVGGFRNSKCLGCGTVFTNPRPDRKSLSGFYETFEGHDDQAFVKASLRYYSDPGRRAARHKDYLAPLLARKQSGRLLDFGCGAGWFAAMARDEGFEVDGIEQMPAAVEAAQKELGLSTVRQGDEDALPETPTYDVIVCNNLIEHVTDPLDFARKVRASLKPGGLWMVNFPSADSAMFKSFGAHSYYFMTPYHLTHFTRSGFSAMMARAGFQNTEYDLQSEAFYWMKGFVSKLGLADAYARWRNDPDFVSFDIALDGLLASISLDGDQPALNEICFAKLG